MALYLFILGNEASELEILHMVTNPFLISFVSPDARVTKLWLGIREAEHTAPPAGIRGAYAAGSPGTRGGHFLYVPCMVLDQSDGRT
ncbi:MAG TPA: hypothetical protein GX510_03530 [Firmicutes bacterium]|nr:hypothetical protein [Candidatus Fermentithermobacillaceae bacterium]